MKLDSTHINYVKRRKMYASGGQATSNINYAALAAGAGSVVDAVDPGNSMGRQSVGGTTLKYAASGAALGTSILPGWGTAIGAVVGAGAGLIMGSKAKKKETAFLGAQAMRNNQNQIAQSQARIAANPEEVTGYDQGATGGYYASGGQIGPKPGLFATNKKAYVDSTLNANKNLDWVKRLKEPNTPSIQVPGQSFKSTHFMADDGNGYVFPTVVRDNNQLKYLGDDAEDYAHRTNTGIQFPKKEGTWFAANGYKKGTGVLNGFANGGQIGDPDQTLYDNTNMLISKGGNPMLQKNGAIMRPGVNSPNIKDRQLMLTDIGIYNQRPEVKNMSPDARLNNYYQLQSNNPAINTIKTRLRTNYGGSGPVASYNALPNLDKTEPAVAKLAHGGSLQPMSKTSVDVNGPSHANGGVDLPGNNEVEGNETIDNGYVFSQRLGFSAIHRPIAKAIGKIEKKPYTPASANALTRLNQQVENLKLRQEQVKSQLNLQ